MTTEPQKEKEKSSKEQFRTRMEEKVASIFDATSLGELRQARQARKVVWEVSDLLWDLSWVAENKIMASDTIPQMFDGVKSVLREAVGEVDLLEKQFPDTEDAKAEVEDEGLVIKSKPDFVHFVKSLWDKLRPTTEDLVIQFSGDIDVDGFDTVKQYGDVAILKNDDGEEFFYARFTNNAWDKEEEVLTTEAHTDFVKFLDKNPDKAPELWDWHEQDTAKTHRAIWWDFSDGFFHSIWPITSDEAKGVEAFMGEFEPAMSHGFREIVRDPDDPRQIIQYRTFEASILPKEFAANEWTTFELIKEREGENKMFSEEKRRALELLSLGKYVVPLGKASEEDAQNLDASGVQRKEGTEMSTDTQAQPPVPVEEKIVAPTPPTPEFEATVVKALDLLTQKLDSIVAQVTENSQALAGIKEKKGQSPTVAAWLAQQEAQSAVGKAVETNGTTDKDDLDPLFGAGPTETPFEADGHLLKDL